MSALMQIGRRRKRVTVDDQSIEVGGVSANDLFRLAERFPPFLDILQRKMPNVPDLVACGSGLVGAMIAGAFGTLDNVEEEKHAAGLDLEIQFNLLIDIYEVTFPGGVGPFVQRVKERFGIDLAADDQTSDETPTDRSKSTSPASTSADANDKAPSQKLKAA